jgi:hypothetical protein
MPRRTEPAIARAVQQRRVETARIAAAISAQLEALWIPGGHYECRMFHRTMGTLAVYSRTTTGLAQVVAPHNGIAQIYLTVNRVNPEFLAALGYPLDRLLVHPKTLTGDSDILRRDKLFWDIDPVRDVHLAATTVEHQAAVDRGQAIAAWLKPRGISFDCFTMMSSGNGIYLFALRRSSEYAGGGSARGARHPRHRRALHRSRREDRRRAHQRRPHPADAGHDQSQGAR